MIIFEIPEREFNNFDMSSLWEYACPLLIKSIKTIRGLKKIEGSSSVDFFNLT